MKIKVPFTDLAIKNPQTYIHSFSSLLNRGDFILSKEVEEFEKEFAKYLGVTYCVGVASGTDAIMLSLRALGIGANDEVIVPAFTFVASATPLLMIGARPIFVDISPDLPLIDVDKIEAAITKKTKAIIAVQLYGFVCNMDKLKAISKKYNIALIEDVSQATGSEYKSKKAGSFGDIGTFSFYPTKNLGAFGDAGAVVTSNRKIYNTLLLLRNHGQAKKYEYQLLGYNSRLDSLQAAMLRLKLKQLDKENKKREMKVEKYIKKLSELPIKLFYQDKKQVMSPAYHLFVIRYFQRDRLYSFLEKKGISCGIHYPKALVDEKIFTDHVDPSDFPNAREYASSVLSLPLFPGMSDKQLNYISDSVLEFFS
jgi:dTDP-4-amino-4,6-dideoxygalactose transaminase